MIYKAGDGYVELDRFPQLDDSLIILKIRACCCIITVGCHRCTCASINIFEMKWNEMKKRFKKKKTFANTLLKDLKLYMKSKYNNKYSIHAITSSYLYNQFLFQIVD